MGRIPVKRIIREEGWIRSAWAERIRAARLAAGLTQVRMARASGLSQATVSAIENAEGDRPIDTKHLEAICEALGMEPADLLCPQPGPEISPLGRDLLAVVEAAPTPERGALAAMEVILPYLDRLQRRRPKASPEGGG